MLSSLLTHQEGDTEGTEVIHLLIICFPFKVMKKAAITLGEEDEYKQVLVLRHLLRGKPSSGFLECGMFIPATQIHSFKSNTLLVPRSCKSVVLFK